MMSEWNSITKQMKETNTTSNCRNRGIPSWNRPIEEVTRHPLMESMTPADYLAVAREKAEQFRNTLYSALKLDLEDDEGEEAV
jgi:hypothetical protein